MGKGFLVSKEEFENLHQMFNCLHVEFGEGKDKAEKNPRIRVFIKMLRKLLWPRISYKSYNNGTQGVYRAPFHSVRELLAQG